MSVIKLKPDESKSFDQRLDDVEASIQSLQDDNSTFKNEVDQDNTEFKDEVNGLISPINDSIDSINGQLIDIVQQKLPLKADKVYVDNQIGNIGNASPKGAFSTLAILQAAFPTGATGIYVVSADGGWYYWNGSAWTKGGTYQSTALPIITPSATSFIKVGKNLFNKDTVTPNSYITDDAGTVNSFSNMSASDFIPVLPNTQYTRNYLSPYCVFYDINKVRISAIPNTNTFTTPVNCYYIRVTVSPSSNVDGYQLELGSTQTSYEKFKYILDESINIVPSNGKVNFLYPDYLMQSMTLKYHGDNWNGIGESGFLFNPFLTKNDKKISFKLGSNFQIFFFEIGSKDVLDINSKKLFLNMKLLSHAINTFTLGIVVQGWDGTQYVDISTTSYFDLVSETTKEVRLSYTISSYYSKIAVKFLFNNGTNDVGKTFDILDFIPYSNATDIGIYTIDDLAKTFKSDTSLVEKDMPHYGKTYSAIGDSITAIDGMYTDIISSICKFGTVNNYGVGGTCLTKLSDGDNSFVDRLPSMTNLSKSDIVSVFGGTNDINNSRQIGTLGNNNVATFIGALEYIINYIYTQNVNAKIILITPFRSKIVGGVYDNTNSLGLKMKDYADAVKLVGQTYSLPVVDLYNECGCNTKNINVLTSDGVHPVKNFSFRIANMIGSKINSI